MKYFLTALAILGTSTGVLMAQEQPDTKAAAKESAVSRQVDATAPDAATVGGVEDPASTVADEAAIRQAIDSYVEAFNKGDAKALAAHWGEQGEFSTPAGETMRGRAELEASFATYFEENKGAKLELAATEVSFFSPSVAVETGFARVILPEDEPSETEYEAVHVKTATGWKIDKVREQEPIAAPPSHYEQLRDLEWMIGRWVDDGADSSSIEVNCRWTTNQNFLVRTFRVYIEDRVDFEGSQVIGWDPHAQAIRSWLFDSDGGFGAGRWSGAGDRWTVSTLNVLPDGRRASATNIYNVIDESTVRFNSIGRQVDGELLPNIDSVTIVQTQN